MNKLFESVDNLFDSGKSLINEDYRDDVINDLGIEPGSDEEAQVDEILNTVPTVYDVFTLSQVDVNEYKSDLYTTVEDEDQAYDIVAELGAQGINAFVESRDANEDVIVPNNFLSGLYARDLNESTEGLSKEDKICRLEDKIKECKDRIEEIGNTEFFDDGSYEAGLELEDRAMERASLEYAISEYQKEIDELKGETINEGSKYDLYSIRGEIRDDETGRLMLHTKNKNNGLVGCANFFGDGSDMVTVYEGNGDGSDDKSMGFDEFLANYDYVLADEDEQPFGVTEASEEKVFVKKVKGPNGQFFDIYKKDGKFVDEYNNELTAEELKDYKLVEDESNGSTAILYQVTPGKTREFGFESLKMLDKFGIELSLDNYTEVANIDYSKYTDATDTNAILEAIFREGNTNQDMRVEFPTMRSVSMSDIVLLDGRYYYCDDFGWTDVTDRLTSVNESEGGDLKSQVVEYLTSKYGEGFELEDNVNGFTNQDEIIDSIVNSYEGNENLTVAEFIDSLIEPHGLIVVKSKGLSEGTSAKRIARYNEFDNGRVLHSWKDMTDEEAEELAKQKSIEDPNNVYYVCNDNVMNPTSDKVWYNGKSYDFSDVKFSETGTYCESEETDPRLDTFAELYYKYQDGESHEWTREEVIDWINDEIKLGDTSFTLDDETIDLLLGFQHDLHQADMEDLDEASKPLVKDKFYIDGVGPEFDGYHDPSVLWNGWECPFFTKEVADEITKTFTDESVTFEYDESGKKYIITWNGEDTEEVPMTRRETVDGELDLFPLGYYGWCWNKASDDLEESNKLDETAWKGTLKSGSALRALINNPDDTIEYYQAVLDKIKDVCNEAIPMCDDEYYANGFQSVIDDIECIYYDEELDEGNVDYILDGLWDWADGAKLFVALGESEVVMEEDSNYTNKYRCVTAGYDTVETFDSKDEAIAFAKENDRVYSVMSDLYQGDMLISVGLNDIWSKYDEDLTEASSVDGLVTKFVELPYSDFKANNAIGVLNDGTVFWVDSENEAYSVPCSYDELKRAMYGKEQDDWMEFSQSFTRIEDPLETKIMVAIGRYSEDVLGYHETFKDGLPF